MQLPVELNGVPKAQILIYNVSVNKTQAQAMLDSGASINTVSVAVVDRAGGQITASRESVRYIDQRVAKVEGATQLKVRNKGHESMVTCLVIKDLGVDLILGRLWLQEWNPTVNWHTGVLEFSDGVEWKPIKRNALVDEAGDAFNSVTMRLSERDKRRVLTQEKETTKESNDNKE